jgi:hypothetical protein
LTFLQEFFIGSERVALVLRKPVYVHAELQPPYSYVWVCRHCGTTFGMAPVEGQQFLPIRGCCEGCRDRAVGVWETPGSLWVECDPDFLSALPEAVLRRELQLHLSYEESLCKSQSA